MNAVSAIRAANGIVRPAAPQATDILAIARSLAQAAIEVLAGTRPAQQLSRSMDPRCLSSLQHRAALTRAHAARSRTGQRLHRSPVVRSVHACAISEGIYETTLVVAEENRSRAVAMRLERCDEAWKVTALEIG
ncbi:Rv3235 family protein [Arthrobacter sp. CJ23]|uniref:Rv3235 family protein n=1 Tax=Arthrobacter sp. CJ23 TaxID=2972479 RepID=UPI00215C6CEF|nr:Rv3235 family protein [Arthrobacter sp. CJ23]UVJ38329.1 Rv3235 family protein [Arthrobacter sp. CJ23]